MIKTIIKQELITFGKLAQHTVYTTPKYVHSSKPPPRSKEPEKGDFSLSRTRITLFRLIHCNINNHGNFIPVFLTLTYAKNEQNRKRASHDLRLFHMRLNYQLDTKLRYIAVPEYQKRGAIHYHIIYFNLPYTPVTTLYDLWGQGTIKIIGLYKIKSIASYLSKYVTKELLDTRHRNSRLLISSRGLIRPQIYHNEDVDIKMKTPYSKVVATYKSKDKIIKTYAI